VLTQPTLIDLAPLPKDGALERVAFDFYETPPAVVRAFADLVRHHLRGRHVLEPCVGDGAIARVLLAEFECYVTTNDIDPARTANTTMDAGNVFMRRFHTGAEVEISNPPFNQAIDIVRVGVSQMRSGGTLAKWIAHLLPLNFMEPVGDRRAFLAEHPPQHRMPTERIKFRTDTNNSAPISTEWVIWTRDRRPLDGVEPNGIVLWKHL
jgi:hypothetical protein